LKLLNWSSEHSQYTNPSFDVSQFELNWGDTSLYIIENIVEFTINNDVPVSTIEFGYYTLYSELLLPVILFNWIVQKPSGIPLVALTSSYFISSPI